MKNLILLAAFGLGIYLLTKKDTKEYTINSNSKLQDLKNWVNSSSMNVNLKNVLISKFSQFTTSEIETMHNFFVVADGDCNSSTIADCGNKVDAIFSKYSLTQYFQG